MNALTLLKQDHGNVDNLFRQFEEARGSGDHARMAATRDTIVEQLSVHAAIEEQVFYPALRERFSEKEAGDFEVLEGLEEHHVVKWTLSEVDAMATTDERFTPKMTVLIESVRHHVAEEENELFEKVREHFTNAQLERLGKAMAAAKETAPTKPHPRTPDTPPLNVLLGVPVAIVDRALQTGRQTVDRLLHNRAS